jgi:hypothetical protein
MRLITLQFKHMYLASRYLLGRYLHTYLCR